MAVCDPALGAHAARVASHAEAVARRLGWDEARIEGCGSALRSTTSARSTSDPGCSRSPGALDAGRAGDDPRAPRGGGLADRRRPVARRGAAVRPLPPRALGRATATRPGGRGTSIPLEGRLLAVADAFDAMTSARPYRGRRSTRGRGGRARSSAAPGRSSTPRSSTRCSARSTPASECRVERAVRRRLRQAPAAAGSRPSRASAQTSSFVCVRRITSSVNAVVPWWPPRSAVRMPSATASRQRLADRPPGGLESVVVGVGEQRRRGEDHRHRVGDVLALQRRRRAVRRLRHQRRRHVTRRRRTRRAATPSRRSSRTAAARGRRGCRRRGSAPGSPSARRSTR